jgi:DNA invertase Pin-like site-specific DNA recombinase
VQRCPITTRDQIERHAWAYETEFAMLVGYARTSSAGQVAGLEAQERELRAAGCERIFREQVSSIGQRDHLEQALDYVREGDTFAVTKLDRLARSVGDLLNIVARLEAKNVSLRVLSISGNQPLDTSTAPRRQHS